MNLLVTNSTSFFDPIVWLIGLGVVFSLFLLAREFFCWYWKINKIVDLLEDIKKNTSSKNKNIES